LLADAYDDHTALLPKTLSELRVDAVYRATDVFAESLARILASRSMPSARVFE